VVKRSWNCDAVVRFIYRRYKRYL